MKRVSHLLFAVGSLAGLGIWLPARALAQAEEREGQMRLVTTVSELDYLKAGKERVTIQLKLATPRQIFSEVGKQGRFRVGFQGSLPDVKLADVSFTNKTVKEILVKLSEQFKVGYSVGSPDSLTVIAGH